MNTRYRSFFHVLISILSLGCSGETQTKRLLNDYPLEQTSDSDQLTELESLTVADNRGNKDLSPGIYCATISYDYGDDRVGNAILKDGKTYGARVDTIEVALEREGNSTLTRLSALIMNNRKDIFLVPQDSLTKQVHDETITFHHASYSLLRGNSVRDGFAYLQVTLNNQLFYTYDIRIFAKGGRCANTLSRSVPTIDETLAINLKHEALLPSALAIREQGVLDATRQIHAQSMNTHSDRAEYEYESLSAGDKAAYDERQQQREDDYIDLTSGLEDRVSRAKSKSSRLKSPSDFTNDVGTENTQNLNDQSDNHKATQEAGLWDRFKGFVSRLFSGARKPQHFSLDVTSLSDLTEISLKQGDQVRLSATGSIVLGIFAGPGGPDGIAGWKNYCKKPELNHGALMGKVGEGEWFLIGPQKSFVSQSDGILHLGINVTDPEGDSGKFAVECNINQ